MKLTVDKQDNYTAITLLDSKLDSLLAPDLKSELVVMANEGVKHLIMDLSQVQYVDSSGLSALLTAERLWKEKGSFILTGVNSESVLKLIEISKLEDVFTILPTLDDALALLKTEEMAREFKPEE